MIPKKPHLVDDILKGAGINDTITKASWCLREGLSHIISVNHHSLQSIILQSGPPRIYESIPCRHEDSVQNMKKPTTCFQSLCRIVAGQQLGGAAAQSVWERLLETTKPDLTPNAILDLAQQDLTGMLQKPSGLSGAKARSILNLAEQFNEGILSETFLQTADEHQIREALLKVRGIGPWSCDMFLLFYLERKDILPLGDLGVRKGMAKKFGLRGSGINGSLCLKRDLDKMQKVAEPYAPYRSLFTFYMWKVADMQDIFDDSVQTTDQAVARLVTPIKTSPRKRARK